LAKKGFADSIGLAAASLGLEARVCLDQKKIERAIELYLEQLAADDPSAVESLHLTAGQACQATFEEMRQLAKNPRTQYVITSRLVSDPPMINMDHLDTLTVGRARNWSEAVEAAGVRDIETAERMALVAYQSGEMDLAQRWIKRASNSPVTQWLHAKLLVRAGKVPEAAQLLERVARYFPFEPHGTNAAKPAAFKDNLSVGGWDVNRYVLCELGVVRLALRNYPQALDALLRSDFWPDAAYVAERVLTLDELKAYVDSNWPVVSPEQIATERETYADQDSPFCPARLREQIRYLLARRLTRELRGNEARLYYPAEWTGQFDALVAALDTGWDETKPADQRAKALSEAAIITRTNGMELLGTEIEPDWHADFGYYDVNTVGDRATNNPAKILVASQDELRRAAQHKPDPDKRFHYRYQAAALAWEAAKLMPNNSDETAIVLWQAGSWLKDRDPATADLFYKSLVRRNRKTALGAEADRRHWFPEVDEQGNIVPRRAREKQPDAQVTPPPATEDETTFRRDNGGRTNTSPQ
jgi:tetratricopeptide (TPR) repeat protein